MKNYATHRLYYPKDKYQGKSVVTLNEQGEVLFFSSLEKEIEATEWIGGIIILSAKATISPEESYNDLLTQQHFTTGSPLYAWHLSHFDFRNETPTPESILRKLH